jgi:outer membrane protein OmpA-like peptidoglycan-associated protein
MFPANDGSEIITTGLLTKGSITRGVTVMPDDPTNRFKQENSTMKFSKFITASALFIIALAGTSFAQTIEVTHTSQWVAAKRQIVAVKYIEDRQTAVNMAGTSLAPRATGKADVEFKHGRSRIKLEMENLGHPQSLGAYYTTYILWAVAPEGQAESLVELPISSKFNLDATTKLQTFALMITAEPHARVALPSPVIVAENALRRGTEGNIGISQIEYSGDSGMLYVVASPNSPALNADFNTPLLILGARRAVWIAQRAGAGEFAPAELRDSEVKLEALEQSWPQSRRGDNDRKNAERYGGQARDVMRLGEHARSLTVERSAQARLATERRNASDTIAQAQSDADRARTDADRATMNADHSRMEAERSRIEAERARRSEREETTRAAGEAALSRERVAQAQSETETAKANEAAASNEAMRARIQAVDALRERDAARQGLYVSLSEILETRREARGLIVNLSDVLFDTGQATLKPGAREKLSKLAGILLAYPGAYQIEIEGHTDSVGSEESNLRLSQGRADSVHDYLLHSGVKPDRMMTARGFGKSTPVASNDTAAGRQVNRRVEIIIEDSVTKAQASN